MNLSDILLRVNPPQPWAEGEKIPWNEPEFSRRMLDEHLSQEHDLASRRFAIIDRHVQWIQDELLKGKPSKILDLGCGPGFYANRFARLGHRCVGIDFSPASIEYAVNQTCDDDLDVDYRLGDIRKVEFGEGYDLAMLVFGEFNVFRPEEAKGLLRKMHHALLPGGILLLEPQDFETVKREGKRPPAWYGTQSGLFSDKPPLCLQERFWVDDSQVTINRFHIVDMESGELTSQSATTQAYTDEELQSMLDECGFERVRLLPSLGGESGEGTEGLKALVAAKSQS